jgi:Alternative splicing regulator
MHIVVSSNDATADELWCSEEAASYSTMTNVLVVFISSTFNYRYDVRATLESAPVEHHDNYINRLDFLPPAEQQAEMMAEKERYYSLYINEVEEELYKGETNQNSSCETLILIF